MIHRGAGTLSPQPVDESAGCCSAARTAGPPPHPPIPGTIRTGAVCAQAGNPRGNVPSRFLEERWNEGGGRSPRARCQWWGLEMSRAGGRMRMEPSSRSEPSASSPPSLLLQTGTLCPALDPPPHISSPDHPQGSPSSSPLPPRGVGTHGMGALAGFGGRGPARLGAREPQGQAASGARRESPFLELS